MPSRGWQGTFSIKITDVMLLMLLGGTLVAVVWSVNGWYMRPLFLKTTTAGKST